MRLALVLLLAAPAVAEGWDSLYREGVAAAARGDYRQAVTLWERADAALPDDAPVERIVKTKLALGTALVELGEPEAALEGFLEGRQRILERSGPFSAGVRVLTLRAGMEAMRLSRLPQAELLLCECLESLQLASDRDDPMRRVCVSQLAALAARRGNLRLAQELALLSVEGAKRRLGDEEAMAAVLSTFGEVALEAGDHPRAIGAFRRAIGAWERADAPDHDVSGRMRALLAKTLAEARRRAAAAEVLDALMPSIERADGYGAAVARATAVSALLELGQVDPAERVIEGLRRTAWPRLDIRTRAMILLEAGRLKALKKDDEAAAKRFRDLLQLLDEEKPLGLLAARAHFALAMTLARLGGHEDAVEHAEQALKLMWRSLGREHRLVRMAVAAYDRTFAQAKQAGADVRRLAWLDFDADDAAEYERLRREADKAARNSDWNTALALADRAVALAPWKSEALEERARWKLDCGDRAGAVGDFTRALAWGFRPELLALRAGVRRNKEDSSRAIADATVHLEFEPESVSSWLNRGSVHFWRLEFDLAARNLAHVESGPKLAHAKWFEVLAYLGMREPDRASVVLDSDDQLRLSSRAFRAHFHEARAIANFAVGRFEASVADCTKALALNVDIRHLGHHPGVLRAIIYQEEGEWDKAARDLETRLVQQPRSRVALVYAAYGLWQRDGREAAARFIANRLNEGRSDESLVAVALCVAGDVSPGELARRAQAANPLEACRLYYHLGRIHELGGDATAASGSFAAAAAIDAGPLVEYWAAVRRTK